MLLWSSEAGSEIYFCLYEQKAAEASGGGEGGAQLECCDSDGLALAWSPVC